MIDPSNITNYKMTDTQLEESLLFWICAAGKNALTSAKGLESLLLDMEKNLCYTIRMPLMGIREYADYYDKTILPNALKKHGIGCYNQKAQTMIDLAYAIYYNDLNLRTCSVEDLEKIKGIGPKTARCFIIHSRENARHAGLDTHILKFLRDMGYDVPVSTPTGKKYKELERLFLHIADSSGMDISTFDLIIWNIYSGKEGYPNRQIFVEEMKEKFLKYNLDVVGKVIEKINYPRSAA